MKTTNRESIEAIFTQALAIPSFTNTETEQGIEAYLDQRLAQIPYFTKNSWMRQTFALEASPFWKRNRIHERNEVRI